MDLIIFLKMLLETKRREIESNKLVRSLHFHIILLFKNDDCDLWVFTKQVRSKENDFTTVLL